MKITKLVGAITATAVTFGIGAAPPASATDNIKIFGEQERLNGPNGFPYIGYTVYKLAPSNDPVPHNGTLYSAKLIIDNFSGANPMIERFGARAEEGAFYPVILGASTLDTLYFDIVGVIPNSVVWNDGTRDILAWVPGTLPLEGFRGGTPPPEPEAGPENSVITPGSMPTESDPGIVATPNDLAAPPYELSEAEVAEPGFNR